MLGMVALVFTVPVILGVVNRHGYPANSAYEHQTAWTACQAAVRAHLKAPATARFTGPRVSPGAGEDETQIIAAAVDAQNSGGALFHTQFVCEVSLVGADWMAYVTFVK